MRSYFKLTKIYNVIVKFRGELPPFKKKYSTSEKYNVRVAVNPVSLTG